MMSVSVMIGCFFFQAEDGIRDVAVTGVQTCALPICLPLVYAHLVGGQDEIVFDGCSFAVQADGSIAARAPAFAEALPRVEVRTGGHALVLAGEVIAQPGHLPALWSALEIGRAHV